MPKKAVVEFECERCPRKWYADESSGTPSLKMTLTGPDGEVIEEVDYEVLCTSCASTCMNYVGNISKKMKKNSSKKAPQRKKKAKEEEPKVPPPTTLGSP